MNLMKKIRLNIVLTILFLSCHFTSYFQVKDNDNLEIQKITVVKSYRPSLNNVFKIRLDPIISDSLLEEKLSVKYDYISVPVVSTFVPNKASPLKLQRQESSILHNSYFSWGYGNQSQALIDFASMISLDRNQSLGIDFNFSSLGNQENRVLKSQQNYFVASFLHLFKSNNFRVESDFKFDRKHLNFYGLYSDYDWTAIPSFRPSLIDPEQNLNYLRISSNWEWYSGVIKKVDFNTMVTIDYFDTTEHLISLNSEFRLPIIDFYLELKPNFSRINTNFVSSFKNNVPLSNQSNLLNMDLQVVNLDEKMNFKLGTKVFYLFGDSIEKTNVYFFPKIKFSYNASSLNLTTFIEVDGDFELNSFTSFSKKNPYISPSLELRPTNIPYRGRLGIKTSPGSGVEFFLAGIYSKSENSPLFKRLPYLVNNNDLAYKMASSYEVVYDKLEELGFETGILMRFNEHNKLSLNTRYVNPISFNEIASWNVPSLKINFDANFRFYDKIYLQASGRYFGRRDSAYHPVFLNPESLDSNPEIESLKGFLYFSSRLLYQTSSNWAFFIDVKNNFGSNFSRWAYYQDYNNNFLLGLRYKFDIIL